AVFIVDVEKAVGDEGFDLENYGRSVSYDAMLDGTVDEYHIAGMANNHIASGPAGNLVVNNIYLGPGLLTPGGFQLLRNINPSGGGVRRNMLKDGSQVVDMAFANNGFYLLALTKNNLHTFDFRGGKALGEHWDPQAIGSDNTELSVDRSQGQFALVVSRGDNSLKLARLDTAFASHDR